MSWSLRLPSASPEETRALAAHLASAARPGDVIVLAGSLGAGKTTFAQGFAHGLGVRGPVTSPTFTLVRQYPCALGQLVHADIYRLDQLAEVADLGIAELVEHGVALVEWGNVATPALAPVTWTIEITKDAESDDGRTLTVRGDVDDRRDAVVAALGPALEAR